MTVSLHTKRRVKLIKPGLQLRLTLVLVGFAGLALMLQALLFMGSLSRVALALPNDGSLALEEMMAALWRSLGFTVALSLPALLALGILTTFRFAGPIYRLERFLHEVLRGARPADCRLRKGDELHDFCALLNDVTRPLREEQVVPPSGEDAIDDGNEKRGAARSPKRIAG